MLGGAGMVGLVWMSSLAMTCCTVRRISSALGGASAAKAGRAAAVSQRQRQTKGRASRIAVTGRPRARSADLEGGARLRPDWENPTGIKLVQFDANILPDAQPYGYVGAGS
jgi:hypothetical protein